ncbi:MAG: hypothetical protein U9Q97_10265 [Acidobacteriota bacterium]|nr:hypothetical protein [Acidobacteriota bacterium]
MIDCEKLCEAIGIESCAFLLEEDETRGTCLRSDYAMIRTLATKDYESEAALLRQVLILYKHGLEALAEEAKLISIFYNTFYEGD